MDDDDRWEAGEAAEMAGDRREEMQEQINAWKAATMLVGPSGDPSDLKPEHLERAMVAYHRLQEHCNELVTALRLTGGCDWDYDDKHHYADELEKVLAALPKDT